MAKNNLKRTWLRLGLLIVSLSAVLTTIHFLKPDSLKPHPQTRLTPKQKLRLCRTRIDRLEWPKHLTIYEDKDAAKARWMAKTDQAAPRELDYLKIEKWFGINCEITVSELPHESIPKTAEAGMDFVDLHFVDGTKVSVRKAREGVFFVDGKWVKSRELGDSFKELESLGEAPAKEGD